MSVLVAILLFSFLIFIHELGHFVAAKLSGVQVNEFALFMGPAIYKKQVGETLYSIRTIPIGGYCAMEGEEGDSENPRSFQKAAVWKRLIILVAGAAMNFVAGLLLLAIVYAPAQQFAAPVIDYFEEGCLLEAKEGDYGLKVGDRILSVDGEKLYTSSDFSMLLSLNPGEVHDIRLQRDGRIVELEDFHLIKGEFPDGNGGTRLRYGFNFSLEEATFANKISYVWTTALNCIRNVRLSFEMLLSGQAGLVDLGGPVMIVDQMAEVAETSATWLDALLNMLFYGAFIAINLSVMNLLPIPALDGGRVAGLLITAAIEAVTRKKLDPKYEGYVHAAGMFLLLGLMAVIMFKDIFMIFKR
jgi:regulator of sigma E protease